MSRPYDPSIDGTYPKRVALEALAALMAALNALRAARVVVYSGHPAFDRPALGLAELLRRNAIPTVERYGMSFTTRAEMARSRDLWIGFWFATPRACLPRRYVVWNPEPLDQPRSVTGVSDEWFETLAGARRVWDYKIENLPVLEQRGIQADMVPFGYSPAYERAFSRSLEGLALDEDIDVLFFGSLCPRRELALQRIADRGHTVFVASGVQRTFGDDLDRLIARSKIVLGIHQMDEPVARIADLARVAYPLSNRRFVIHELPEAPSTDPGFAAHIPCPAYDDIVETVEYFLERPAEREHTASLSHDWFKGRYPLEALVPIDSVRALLTD